MNQLCRTLEEQAFVLVVGTSVILGVSSLLVALVRGPLLRQRYAELGCGGALLWCLLVCVPLPRFEFPSSSVSEHGAVVPDAQAAPSPAVTVWPLEEARGSPQIDAAGAAATPTVLASVEPSLPPPPPGASLASWVLPTFLGSGALAAAFLVLGALLIAIALLRSRRAPAGVAERFAEIARESLARVPRLRVVPDGVQPFCLGFGRGLVVVPARLLRDAHGDRLEVVLRHEVAHLARKDWRGRLLFAAALPLFALHPLFWWLRDQAHFATETLADELASRASGRARYVREMVEFAADARTLRLPRGAAMSWIRSRSEFFRRMQMLMQREGRLATSCSSFQRFAQNAFAVLVVSIPAVFVGAPSLAAQQDPTAGTANEIRALLDELSQLRKALTDAKREIDLLKAESGKLERPRSDPAADVAGVQADPMEAKSRATARTDEARSADARLPRTDFESVAPPGSERGSSDVVALLNARIDLQTELKVAHFRLQRAEALKAKGATSDEDFVVAQARLEATQAKLQVAMRAIETERIALRNELELVVTRIKRGASPAIAENLALHRKRLEAKLRMFD